MNNRATMWTEGAAPGGEKRLYLDDLEVGQRFVSGSHALDDAITMRLNVESGLPLAGGVVGAGGEITWPKPTRPGDVLHVENRIMEIVPSRSRPDRGMVTVRGETLNQRDEIVQVLIAKLVVPRRSPTSGTNREGTD